ncbi:hypothetical protein [Roseivirga misakiensis]|uniref:Uncharacterized protein n=1 Tax=Roseivirga misakiensis TaxID=1563681 RepID=A0A1E5T5D5_9BACT|nr:hypothetical protein [Roseivirga misakiensis]OEK06594.1 hypothetical protein BFP71_02685 [Roseivirga misakiensis]
MKKTLRIVSIAFLSLIVLLFIGYIILNEKLPEGEVSPEADVLAEKMTTALNMEAWELTENISWTFRGTHFYEWDKAADVVKVRWDEYEVVLNTKTESGLVVSSKNEYSVDQFDALIKTAYDFFNNDSFWLYAPFKVFDPGVERSIVVLKDGQKALKVTYTTGGSTPGDSYVWILGEDFKPVAVKMWASILPIGGMEFTWENYLTLPSGALIAQDHFLYGSMNIPLTDIR